MVMHQLHCKVNNNNMLVTVAILLGALGQLSHGVPLEDPSRNFSQYFDQRIVGGSVAPEAYSKHMVALVVGRTFVSFVCGGSILTPKHILTAAHCIDSFIMWDGQLLDTLHALVGSNVWHKGTVLDLLGYRLHPEYDRVFIKSDAGILITKIEIVFTGRVCPVGLNLGHIGGQHRSVVTGWGTERLWGPTPNHLKILYVNTLGPEECVKLVPLVSAAIGMWAPHVDPKVEICTYHSAGNGMCHGDSGSALLSVIQNLLPHGEGSGSHSCGPVLLIQIGIVSWGFPCAVGGPDMFVRVSGSSIGGFICREIGNHVDYCYRYTSSTNNSTVVKQTLA